MFIHHTTIINNNDEDSEIIEKLKKITDEDFNGGNGEEHLFPFFKNKFNNNLEGCYYTDKNNIQAKDDLINLVLEYCYSDNYYKGHNIKIIEQNEFLFVSVVAVC